MKEIVKNIDIIPIFFDNVLEVQHLYDVFVLVGGRNSGKSYFMDQLVTTNIHNCDKYKMVIVEDVEVNIGEGVKDGIEERIEDFEYESVFTSIKKPAEIIHDNGNNAIFKGYHSEKQQKQVKSLNEVTAAWYEEGENITYKQFKALKMQLRGGNPEDRTLFITMNPINPDSYINQEFFQKPPTKVLEYFEDGRPKVFEKIIEVEVEIKKVKTIVQLKCMIVCTTHWDNPHLTLEQRAEIEEFKYTDEDLYAMLAECKFIRPGGLHFKEFKRSIHVIPPYKIPGHWDRYPAIDYGLDMLAGIWFAIDERGRAIAYKEIHEPDLIVSKATIRLHEVNDIDTTKVRYGPGDLWNRRQETGKSAADIFREGNWSLTESDRDRQNGTLCMKEWLSPFEYLDEQTGEKHWTANLLIFDTCPIFISHLSQVLTDEKNPNCYAQEPHLLTHILDAFRYFAIMRRSPSDKIPPIPLERFLPMAMREPEEPKTSGLAGEVQQGGFTW